MRHIKQLTIRFLNSITLCFLLSNCYNHDLGSHLKEVNKINNQIDLQGWEVMNKYIIEDECYYNIWKKKGDTVFSVSFTYFTNLKVYKIDDFLKSITKDSVYTEMSLFNSDTLYYFRYINDSLSFNSPKPIDENKINFRTGKYYYLYKRGRFNWKQKDFFENHIDSLTRIRGNDLPEF